MQLYKHKINITILKEYEYCPRLAWLEYNTIYKEPPTPSMNAAKVDLEAIAKELNLPKPALYEKELCNTEYNVCGKPDIIAGRDKKVVVEVKAFQRKQLNHFIKQARAYAWLVQTTIGKVWKYALYINGKTLTWSYTIWDHREIEAIIKKVMRTLSNPKPPKGVNDGRCSYCYFKNICGEKNDFIKEEIIIV